jgi:peptidoglycan/xylan/chitin deacetylase (PgdA/CDA1 family)
MDVVLFDKCISYISSHYQVMLLEDMVFRPDLKSLKNTATIMFDDGYKDNIEYAAPILSKYNVKASFYVVTDCIEKNVLTWTHVLEYCFQYTRKTHIDINFDFLPLELRVISLPTETIRIEYVRRLKPFLKKVSHEDRNRVMNRVMETITDVDLPRLMMDWSDLLKLTKEGHYISSHTVSHAMLGTMTDQNEIMNELTLSGKMIQKHLGYFPKSISYPVGSYNETTIRLSKQAGYSIGLAVKQKAYDPNKDSIYEIPRIELYNENWWKTKMRITTLIETIKSIVRPDNID